MNTCVNVLLYIRDFMTRDQLMEAKKKVDQYKGIINTMLGQVSANILLVDYDPGMVTGKEIVDQLAKHGISAKLVAM